MPGHRSSAELVKEVKEASGCVNPVRLRGEFVNTETGEVRERPVFVACKDRRDALCPSCSYLYKADAWILVSTGLVGGKGVPESVARHPRLFLTLTAPSFGPVHTRGDNGSCQPRRRPPCAHARATHCAGPHAEGDHLLGTPLCAECFDYRGAVLWNAESSGLWNRTIEQVRRRVTIALGLEEHGRTRPFQLSYLKVTEFQRRGLAHFHVVLRADGPEPFSPPPPSLTTALLIRVIHEVAASFSLVRAHGVIAWGRQLHVSDASALARDDLRIAAYLAKYATKTTDGSLDFARRFRSRGEIMALGASAHRRRLALTAWDLAREPGLGHLNLRAHAHTFGVRGQAITKSRHYSTRFFDLREARAAHQSATTSVVPVEGTFSYDGRGYDDPRASAIAGYLHQLAVEARRGTTTVAPEPVQP